MPQFPAKLRIYYSVLNKDKRYMLDVDITEGNYNKIFYSKKRGGKTFNATYDASQKILGIVFY